MRSFAMMCAALIMAFGLGMILGVGFGEPMRVLAAMAVIGGGALGIGASLSNGVPRR